MPGPEHEAPRRAFRERVLWAHRPLRGGGVEQAMPEEGGKEGETMQRRILSESVKQWSAQPRTEGRVESRVEGQAEVVRRQAARKYGTGTAERLAVKRAEIASLERTGEVGD